MLTVACVETGNYLGRGVEYVQKLQAAVARHLRVPYVFRVFTDNAHRHQATRGVELATLPDDLHGWWAKVCLFSPDAFRPGEPVLYLDLDTVVTGPLDALAQAEGILHLARWGWKKNDYGSGVMAWRHGEHAGIWTQFTRNVPHLFRGDQDWMTALGGWPALPDGLCVSYRYHAVQGPPAGAAVVCFHGTPKPHELTTGWVPRAWAGATS